MIYLATGDDVRAARHALGVSQTVLAAYWGTDRRDTVSEWERCGSEHTPHPRIVAILLASLRRGWFPAGGKGIKKKRRQPREVVPGPEIKTALELQDLTRSQLGAYWGMNHSNIHHLMQRDTLPRGAMYDILLDDLLSTRRPLILRWSGSRPPAYTPSKPRGRYAAAGGAALAAQGAAAV